MNPTPWEAADTIAVHTGHAIAIVADPPATRIADIAAARLRGDRRVGIGLPLRCLVAGPGTTEQAR